MRFHCDITEVCSAAECSSCFPSGSWYKEAKAPVKEIRNEQCGSVVMGVFSWEEKSKYSAPASCTSTQSKLGNEGVRLGLSLFFGRKFLLELKLHWNFMLITGVFPQFFFMNRCFMAWGQKWCHQINVTKPQTLPVPVFTFPSDNIYFSAF